MVTDAQGVRHDRQRGIDRAAGHKETGIHDIQIVHVMCLAIDIQRGGGWVVPEAHRSALMCHTCQRDGAIQEEFIG